MEVYPMKIIYSKTAEDRKELVKSLVPRFRFRTMNILILILLALLLLFAISYYIEGETFFATCVMIMITLCLLEDFVLPRIYFTKAFRKVLGNDLYFEEKTMEVGDNELSISSPSRFVSYKYSDIEKVELKSSGFVIVHFKHGGIAAFPTHIFKSDEETMEFISTIKSKANIQEIKST